MRRHGLVALVAMLLVGAVLGAPLVKHAAATITFSIPNTFGSQSGTIAVSQIDDNFTAIRTALSGLVAATTDLPLTRAYTGTQRWAQGANIAPSAGVLSLGSDGNYFVVTGTNGISSISTLEAGTIIVLRFADALPLTHSATLVLLGAVNATTAAGDMYWFISDGGGTWRELWRRPVTGPSTTTYFSGLGTWVAVPSGVNETVCGYTEGAAVGATRYNVLNGGGAGSSAAAVDNHGQPMTRTATLGRMFVKLQTAPGAGQTTLVRLLKNGSASALAVTVAEGATTGSDTSNTVSFAAGDLAGIEITLSGGAADPVRTRWCVEIAG